MRYSTVIQLEKVVTSNFMGSAPSLSSCITIALLFMSTARWRAVRGLDRFFEQVRLSAITQMLNSCALLHHPYYKSSYIFYSLLHEYVVA